ncbi:MBL fold metallo-hydrolase [Geomonas paludis]|uniref:MBL fold metallo-hydrolase n=1 Tax=Geomonas paludis TaxID=2740185 RepID=A0ABY4LAS0_9BACT|nr:MBL fold metallo-hydrolase [Geomonas paludis]UPU35022.1 MBL fold metallo-hydrolase [Geomonas paludis]
MSKSKLENGIEISTFGPGFGESILIHIGGNDWIIIDSCTSKRGAQPAAVEYLRNLGVDPAEAVKLIVATHWHDDHVRGLADTYLVCKAATFVCSSALRQREFVLLAEKYRKESGVVPSGIDEFRKILDIQASSKSPRPPLKWATADRRIWARPASEEVPECEVWALSPSDKSFENAQKQIADLVIASDPVNTVLDSRDINPNHIAVVLVVIVAGYSILLGSDLEETADPDTGWTVIVSSSSRPQVKSSFYKVAHHGSETAAQPLIWEELLHSKPLAVITPFTRLAKALPRRGDVERILGKAPNSHITALPTPAKKASKEPAVIRTLAEMGVKVLPPPSLGQVKITVNLDDPDDAKVELFGNARPLSDLLKSNTSSIFSRKKKSS